MDSHTTLTARFRRRIAWGDGAIRESAGAAAFPMNLRCRGGEDVGARAASVGKRWGSASFSKVCPHAPQDDARSAGRVHIVTAWRRGGRRCRLAIGVCGSSRSGPGVRAMDAPSGWGTAWTNRCPDAVTAQLISPMRHPPARTAPSRSAAACETEVAGRQSSGLHVRGPVATRLTLGRSRSIVPLRPPRLDRAGAD